MTKLYKSSPCINLERMYNSKKEVYYGRDCRRKKANSEDMQTKLALQEAIDSLNIREQYILDERFIIGKTQMEIAEELTISQAQVSRLEKSAITKLKKILK